MLSIVKQLDASEILFGPRKVTSLPSVTENVSTERRAKLKFFITIQLRGHNPPHSILLILYKLESDDYLIGYRS